LQGHIKSGIVKNNSNIHTCVSYYETAKLLCRCNDNGVMSPQYSNF
jgi:hypothetical protein